MQYASLDNGRSVKRDVHEQKTLSDSDKECVAIIVMHVVAPLSVGEDEGFLWDRCGKCKVHTGMDREGRGPIYSTWTRCKRKRARRKAHPDGGQPVA